MGLMVSGTLLIVTGVENCEGFRVNLLDGVLPYLLELGPAVEHSHCRATQPNQSPYFSQWVSSGLIRGLCSGSVLHKREMYFHYRHTSVGWEL